MAAVVQIVTSLERGGAQRLALEAAARLHRPGRPAYLISGVPAALDDEARARLGSRFLRAPNLANPLRPLRDLVALGELGRALHRAQRGSSRPWVVHTHSSKAGVLGRLAGRSLDDVRIVHTVHGFGHDALGPRAKPWLLAAERVATAATDILLCVSQADLARAEALGLTPRDGRRVLPEACDANRCAALDVSPAARAEARARLGIAPTVPLAVTVGNLKPQKDPVFHVEVLSAWRSIEPRAELLFLGDGPLREATLRRAEELGVANALHLPGFVDDAAPALVAADVMLLASRWEGLPLSVLEGLAAGLPTVVRNPGWADDVRFAGERLAALPLDAGPAAFAAALVMAATLGRKQLELPRAFTWEGHLAALDELYDELLER